MVCVEVFAFTNHIIQFKRPDIDACVVADLYLTRDGLSARERLLAGEAPPKPDLSSFVPQRQPSGLPSRQASSDAVHRGFLWRWLLCFQG
jgi:hypothetical protein